MHMHIHMHMRMDMQMHTYMHMRTCMHYRMCMCTACALRVHCMCSACVHSACACAPCMAHTRHAHVQVHGLPPVALLLSGHSRLLLEEGRGARRHGGHGLGVCQRVN